MSHLLGTPRQNAYVVDSVDDAVNHWTTRLGVGPFFVSECFRIEDFHHRGQHAPLEMKLAMSNCGPLQIELIQVLSDGPSDFHEFRRKHGQGMHHMAYWAGDFDADSARLLAVGYEVLHSGSTVNGDPFAYFDGGGHPGSVVELTSVSGAKGEVFAAMAAAALAWDGTEPVRSFDALIESVLTSRRSS